MIVFIISNKAKKNFDILPREVQERILNKLRELKNHPDIFSILKPLKNVQVPTYRLRVGSYRLLLCRAFSHTSEIIFDITHIGHRKDIYT